MPWCMSFPLGFSLFPDSLTLLACTAPFSTSHLPGDFATSGVGTHESMKMSLVQCWPTLPHIQANRKHSQIQPCPSCCVTSLSCQFIVDMKSCDTFSDFGQTRLFVGISGFVLNPNGVTVEVETTPKLTDERFVVLFDDGILIGSILVLAADHGASGACRG